MNRMILVHTMNVDIFSYKFGQTLTSLTSDKSNMQSKKKSEGVAS